MHGEVAVGETMERTAGLLTGRKKQKQKQKLIYWVRSKDANYIGPRCTGGGGFLYNHSEL